MSRDSRASFADYPASASPVLQQGRKKSLLDDRRPTQPYVGPTSLVWKSPSVAARSAARKPYPSSSDERTSISHTTSAGTHVRREDEEAPRDDAGDLLNGVGSASSHASTASSVFSNNISSLSAAGASSIYALTPLTNTNSSPPGKAGSPFRGLARFADDSQHPASVASGDMSTAANDAQDAGESITPIHTPPENRIQARPGPGEEKGFKLNYDPDMDRALTREQRKRRVAEPVKFGQGPDPRPPFDPRLSIPLYNEGRESRNKARLRPAPYMVKVWPFLAGVSTGVWEATQVVVTGFDPFTPEARIKTLMSTYGTVAEVRNQMDPSTGAFLGICLVRFKDTRNKRGVATRLATDAAQAAAREGTGQRIGTSEVKVELDKIGRKCERLVAESVRRQQYEQDKLRAADAARTVKPVMMNPSTVGPPPDAPKGPSGKPPPTGPRNAFPPRPAAHALVENDPIINTLKRAPFIFIAHCYVPVLGTTIPHLQKRLKSYDWKDIRVDKTGYYITFKDGESGRREADRCFRECNLAPLFTYFMNMELFRTGNPDYQRSPSPERVRAEKRIKELEDQFQREEEEDFERQKQERAENLDPVLAAVELLKQELRERLLTDIKERIAAPALFEYLSPDNHIERRRRLGVADPPSHDPLKATTVFGRDSPLVGTPDSQAHGFAGRGRRKEKFQRGRQLPKQVNAFQDERRARTQPRKPAVRALHRQMQDFYGDDEEESEDEQRSVLTRDTEEQESRPLSRAESIIDVDTLEGDTRAARFKRRRLETGWGEDSEDEIHDATARSLLAHLIHKDPEVMAERELEQVLSVLPKSSNLWKRANKVYKRSMRFNQSLQEYDEIFGVKTDEPLLPTVDITIDDEPDKIVESTEPADSIMKVEPVKKRAPPKPKKKTKKQILEEQQALELEEQAKATPTVTDHVLEAEDVAMEDVTMDVEKQLSEEEARAEVDLDFSTDPYPRRTVEDDPGILLDIDGWQHLIKDEEDYRYLKLAVDGLPSADLGDVQLWAMKQKEIKALNNGGISGPVRTGAKIQGYYVPTPSGCARTEPVKKILESEKSKYLPHRIKVQKAREEREARAKNDPIAAAESAKLAAAAKVVSTTSSRSNRANNRRLVNDLNTMNKEKQNTVEGDAVRFNQLKKRKKFVKFDRSAIHNWGLYALENIAANDMIIEYVGERVRQRVADLREAKYDLQGVGSSYLFRIDEDSIVDATKKGGIARFINHSCTPNCTAKIIKVDGTRRIVIYALRDIAQNEELTYDYKFEREINSDDRIPCLCGSIGCKGFLN